MSKNTELKVNMIDVLEILVKRKSKILGFTLLVTAVVAIISLVLTPEYASRTVLMPPSSSETSAIKSILKNTPVGRLGGMAKIANGVPSDLADTYVAILGSRTLHLDVIKKFNLAHVYKFDKRKRYYVEDLLIEFQKHIDYGVLEDGTLFIYARDKRPEIAAEMANYMAKQLDIIYTNLTTEKNRTYRIFLGERLSLVKLDLAQAEKNLVAFQKQNHMVDIESQAKATITTGVALEAQYRSVRGNLEIAQRVYSTDHPKVRELKLELDQLEKQRNALAGDRVSTFMMPYQAGPDLALDYLRLRREQETQQTVFELILQQYEEAKFEESKNTPTVQILDRADVPQKKIFPKRRKMVVFAFVAAFITSCLFVLALEGLRKFRQTKPAEYEKISGVLKQIWTIRKTR